MATVLKQVFEVQHHFDNDRVHVFVQKYWNWSFYISIGYVVTIFALKRWMEKRERYNLRRPLFLWSTLLALFSVYGFWMNGIDHLHYLWTHGWEKSICDPTMIEGSKGLWTFLFCFSKAPELVDTYFIVLRKQKLIFLHWYHHITVFIYCWFHYSRQIHAAQWFIIMNYFVHAVMYTYYAVRASGHYRPPVWVNMFITLLQLTQMIVGVYINIYVCYTMTADSDWYCDGKIETTYLYVYWSFAMYFSYFVLFALFFYETYFKKSSISSSNDGRSKPSNGLLRNGAVNDGRNKFQKCTLDNGDDISTRDGLHKRKTKMGQHISEVGSHVLNEHVGSGMGMRESSTGNNFTDNVACGVRVETS